MRDHRMFHRGLLALTLAWGGAAGCSGGSSARPAAGGETGQTGGGSWGTQAQGGGGGTGGGTSQGGSGGGSVGGSDGSSAGAMGGAGGAGGSGGTQSNGVGGGTGTGTGGTTDGGGGVDSGAVASGAPTGLLTALTAHPELAAITDTTPDFAWIVNTPRSNEHQTAYEILVASTQQNLGTDTGDLWDSGKVVSTASINVPYAGKALAATSTYFWKVRTWDSTDTGSPWSAVHSFIMAAKLGQYSTPHPTVSQTPIAPTSVVTVGTGHYFIDFGRDAFGWLNLTLNAPTAGTVITVNLGEAAQGQAVNLTPGASISAQQGEVTLQAGLHTYRVQTPNVAPGYALPAALGVVLPFRYVEVISSPVALTAASASQIALWYPFDDSLGAFSSSNATLNKVWELSRYSIKATTFEDIYVDGNRERTPYEGDSYIHQLGHYAIDRDYALARFSHEYLMTHATWPTEWKFHSVMMAWADWMYTGNLESLAQQYASLKSAKTLESYANAQGLLNSGTLQDLVDWPAGERDGFVMTSLNSVVNAFYCHILGLMSQMATALGNTADATRYSTMAATATATFNSTFFDTATGLYVDGTTTTHSALHANLFPLAFGLVPANRQAQVLAFVKSRGMACSPYGAQYLLEALYEVGQPDAAVALMTLTSDRSWMNMLNVGSTITMEAWDVKYKSNLDWNHAWGAAPANIIPRYLLGVRPLSPGFAQAAIAPQPGSLTHIEGTVATIRGPIRVVVDTQPLTMTVTIPANMTANLAVPPSATACTPSLDGQAAQIITVSGVSWINAVGSGQHVVGCR